MLSLEISFGTVRRPFDARELGGVARVANGDSAQAMDTLGEQVDELELLVRVFIEQPRKLVEGSNPSGLAEQAV